MRHKNWGLIIILFISAILRFYNLMHDAPYFFNPDERNMAAAITRFVLPVKFSDMPVCILSEFRAKPSAQPALDGCSLNPQFFAYGQFPLYLAYASDVLTRVPLTVLSRTPLAIEQGVSLKTSFASAIFWLRFWSAVSSVLSVLLVYLISRKIFTRAPLAVVQGVPFLTALLAAFAPGLIQSAHFGTTESLLTFFFLASIYFSIRIMENFPKKPQLTLPLILSIGIAIGSKLTGFFFLIPPFVVLLMLAFKRKHYLKLFMLSLTIFAGSLSLGFLSSFYNLVEAKNFQSAVFGYEQDVALGKFEAFYTRQFIETKPILFQLEKVFPNSLGWTTYILGILGFLLMTLYILKKQKKSDKYKKYFLILLTSFIIYLIPNAVLYAKWTRFMTPVLPFFALFAGFLLHQLLQSEKLKPYFRWLTISIIVLTVLPGLAFMSIYAREDSRLTASIWIYENIPDNSYILSETANVVDIPLHIPDYPIKKENLTVISFDFYHLHDNPQLFIDLVNHLEKADFIFMPSRRIWKNYSLDPDKYRLVNSYYQKLFSGELGYEKVAEINSFPALTLGPLSLKFPDENAEETFTVFDHPVIRIFRKVKPYSLKFYRDLLST